MGVDLSRLRGIIVPILTPIDENEMISEQTLRRLTESVIAGGVHGILAFGGNGEFYCVEEDEFQRALRILVDQVQGRVPVYSSIGAIQTKKAIRLAQYAKDCGVDGISVLQPMFIHPSPDELYLHFKKIAESVPDLPVLIYNNPRAGYNVAADVVLRLATTVKNIVGIKDSSGDMTLTCEYIRLTRGMEFHVFGGKDTLIYSAIASGADGCVATTANMFPKLVCSIYNEYMAGNLEASLEAQYQLTPLRLTMDLATFPVGTKDLANLMGLDVGKPYEPTISSPEPLLDLMRTRLCETGQLKEPNHIISV